MTPLFSRLLTCWSLNHGQAKQPGRLPARGNVMSTVLEFPMERAMAVPPSIRTVPGEIVIFPGVRIERREFNLAERVPPRSSRKRSPQANLPEAEKR
jgi:hypothetical protein